MQEGTVPASAVVFGILKNKFITRAEPDVLRSTTALEVFGDEVLYVAGDKTECLKENQFDGLIATWRFQNSGKLVGVLAEAVCITLNFPAFGDVTVCTRVTEQHWCEPAVLHVVCEATSEVLLTFPAIQCHSLALVSNILCLYNPVYKPVAEFLNDEGVKVYPTKTPHVLLQVFSSSKDAYKACCGMQSKILALKKDREQGAAVLNDAALAYSYQRPSLMTYDTAECVRKDIHALKDPFVASFRGMHTPTLGDVDSFAALWLK